jgi:hypothetical protein
MFRESAAVKGGANSAVAMARRCTVVAEESIRTAAGTLVRE